MAMTIPMRNPATGEVRLGVYGFSWTTFFFGGIPALFRKDFKMGLLVIGLTMVTCGFFALFWAFFYNKQYTLGLLKQGFQFAGTPEEIARAKFALGLR